MTQRLFEGELRAASITASAPSPNPRTQASNFSLCRRSAASEDMTTVSILNCRKHSASRVLDDSFKPTSAVRAADLRTVGARAKVVAKALCIVGEHSTFQNHCGGASRYGKDTKDQPSTYQILVTFQTWRETGHYEAKTLWNEVLGQGPTSDFRPLPPALRF